ncbi:MAG: phenylacetate--CoA ligase [Acidimicrobiia bacterium]|nr:phenylacetate--CoA ligase [Acidimicrobiia bacterium]
MLFEAGYYGRMALGAMQIARSKPLDDPPGRLRRQWENRESTFLDTLRRTVFASPGHPYQEMFRLAGCTLEDFAGMVRKEGLEGALAAVNRAGVYLTHDEMKGTTGIVRSGRHIPASPASFLNPLEKGLWEGRSGGSRSAGTRTRTSVAVQLHREMYEVLVTRELSLQDHVRVHLASILPSSIGISAGLRARRLGQRLERWFTVSGGMKDSGHYRAATHLMVALANLAGAGARFPEYLPKNDFSPVARFLAQLRAEGNRCLLTTFVSPAVRVAAAAKEKAWDIRGAVFRVGGEALTEAKRAEIESSGASVFPNYWIHEVGPIGHACGQMRVGNRVHLFQDSVAVIADSRPAPLSGSKVNALLFTTLLPCNPRILINACMDDHGVLGRARCNCQFSRIGFTTTIDGIYSYGKLTGQGMTLAGTGIVALLEQRLPARFGGCAGDYQLVEHEAGGQTQLTLRISPRAGPVSADAVREFFLTELRSHYGGSLASRVWRHSGAIQVEIGEPFMTSNGKVLSLHLVGMEASFQHAS